MGASSIYTTVSAQDLLFMARGALRTIELTLWSSAIGTLLGLLIGTARSSLPWFAGSVLAGYVDALRSVPLLIQFILFNALLAIIGFQQPPFVVGIVVLSLYMSAYVSEVVRGGVLAVPVLTRRAARSLGMSWLQDMRYIVLPIGLRAVFPAWIGLVIGLVKDTSLIAVIGYIELLRAGQIIITRTQEPLLVLSAAGLFYFGICYPVSRFAARLESRMAT